MRRPFVAVLVWAAVAAASPDGLAEIPITLPGAGPADPSTQPGPGERGGPDGPALPVTRADEVAALRMEIRALRERLARIEEGLAASRQALGVAELPTVVEFAGQPVPLDRWDVAERLEREFYLSLGSRGQVILWLKRSARYFPYIERELRRAGLPDDLKYVAVIESSLLPTVYSHASALGIWQFIAPTARRYGLAVTAVWDERRHPERATAAALAYLQDLSARFRDWPLALAAYNAGEGRIEQALRQQGVTSYYQLALAEETERYVLRAVAAKLILAHPERYGFEIARELRYQPHDADVVEIQVRDRLTVMDLARISGSFFREIKALNPQILQDTLPRGRYVIQVPKGRAPHLAAANLIPWTTMRRPRVD